MKPSPIVSILLFVGAAFLLFAAFSSSWFAHDFGDSSFRVGLLRGESCYGSECESMHLFQGRFRLENLVMLMTFACTLAGSILGGIAGLVLLKPGRSVLAVLALVFTSIALFGAILFFIRVDGAKVSYALPIFVVGALTTIVAAAVALGRPRLAVPMPPMRFGAYAAPMGHPYGAPMGNPYAPQPGANPYAPPGAPAAAQGAPCAACSTPTTWVAQYNRWFCARCNKYV